VLFTMFLEWRGPFELSKGSKFTILRVFNQNPLIQNEQLVLELAASIRGTGETLLISFLNSMLIFGNSWSVR
jgi:hypothetical protein